MKAEYIDHMGTDASVANAARISMDKDASNYTDAQNASLIKYLASGMSTSDRKALINKMSSNIGDNDAAALIHQINNIATHWTPFAHTAITLRMSAPLPIRTQCFKHKAGLVENEESRRYITSTPEIFIPETIRASAKNVKQGSAGTHEDSAFWITKYKDITSECVGMYTAMLEEGVCPEQARLILPQAAEVNWIWSGNLFAFANFYMKRSDPHAQLEIRELAEQVQQIIKPLFPVSWSALCEY